MNGGLNLQNLNFLLLSFLCISATLSLGSDGRSGINFFFVQFDATMYTTNRCYKEKIPGFNIEWKKWADLGTLPQTLLASVTIILVGQMLNLPVNPKKALNM